MFLFWGVGGGVTGLARIEGTGYFEYIYTYIYIYIYIYLFF